MTISKDRSLHLWRTLPAEVLYIPARIACGAFYWNEATFRKRAKQDPTFPQPRRRPGAKRGGMTWDRREIENWGRGSDDVGETDEFLELVEHG